MGYLTTFTIYNDNLDNIKREPEQFTNIIYKAACGVKQDYNGLNVITQSPRHANDDALYLHSGNTVINVNEATSKWAIDASIKNMEYQIKRLKKLRNE